MKYLKFYFVKLFELTGISCFTPSWFFAVTMSDGAMEGMVASQLLNKNDPTLLSWKQIKNGWGSCCNFMLSYGLKPYNMEDVDEAVGISRALKEAEQDEGK